MAVAEPVKDPKRQGPLIKFDAEAKAKFCAHFAKTHLYTESAAIAGVDYWTVRQHIKRDPDFREAVRKAKKEHLDSIERAIHRRGVVGWFDETTTYDENGKEKRKSKKYRASDELLKLYAKRHMKAYRSEPNPQFAPTVTVNTQVNVTAQFDALSDEQRAALRAFMTALQAPAQVVSALTPAIENVPANGHANGNGKEIANGNGTH